MKYIKENISKYAASTGFIGSNIEKVMRLLDVLNFLFSKCSFKNKLILKGGTAINLIHTNLKRLSVDIDLDYCGSLDKDIALKDRELLEKELDDFMTKSTSIFGLFSTRSCMISEARKYGLRTIIYTFSQRPAK